MAGGLGLDIDLCAVPGAETGLSPEKLLFSESAGRFLVTVAKDQAATFEKLCKGLPCACIGSVTDDDRLVIRKGPDTILADVTVQALDTAFNKTFGEKI